MKLRPVLIGAVLCLVLVNRSSAQCLCASKGMDFCSCAAAPPVRPVPKIIPRLPLPKFPPIGDSCWCGKQVVEPAIPPKPLCKPPPPPSCKCCCDCASTAALAPRAATCLDALTPPAAVAIARPPGVPADPLSISMALTASKSFAVPEAKLSYGPVAAPLNAIQKIYFSNIPEEKLYGLNGQIIEKKKTFPLPTKAELLAEAIEDAEEEEAAAAAAPAPYLSYADLGYGPALIKKPMFLRLSAQPALALAAAAPKPILAGCGYVPGKVTPTAAFLEQSLEYGAPCL